MTTKIIKIILPALIVSTMLLNLVSAVHAEETVCEMLQRLKAQQPLFGEPDRNLLNVKKVKNPSAKESKHKRSAKEGVYYFILKNDDKVIIFNGHDYSLELSVPEYDWRPISVKWVNPKLIYLSVYFNPHYGAYWIYDVEEEKIIINELNNDGWDAWQQCTAQGKETKIK